MGWPLFWGGGGDVWLNFHIIGVGGGYFCT